MPVRFQRFAGRTPMLPLLCAALATLIASPVMRAEAEPTHDASKTYESILVEIPTREDALRVLREIPDIEFMKPVPDRPGVYSMVSTPEIDQRLTQMGFRVTVVVPDLVAQFEASASSGPNFGIFHTYSETEAYLDSIAATFPAITTDKFSIGNSLEGRAIWAIKVSDNPDVDEDEGEILFDGVTHAREIMTVEMILNYLNYLCSSYGVDPLATFLVNNREIYFVPIVNPDGFVWNETTNPNGGGLWRKNRRVN